MTKEQFQRVKEVFLAVCDRPAEQQEQEVGRLCADDAELKAEVNSLLQSHRDASNPNATNALPQADVPESQTTEADPPAVSEEISRPQGSSPDRRASGKSAISQHRSHVSRTSSSHRDSLDSTPRGRFDSGTILAERYRIVSLLGIGGMGEVYRADDLTLDQPVALKFLPPSFENNPSWLERFHNEVRLSRQVTHPNVCRVFDIGEVEGEEFISMEFVDGEDLSSLLRRIGRLPKDKAIQIARQLCAGLAAAHDKGVLHRDLKPANIMLDGRGQVRITDFGISGRVDGAERRRRGNAGVHGAGAVRQGRSHRPQRHLFARIGALRDFHGPAGVHGAFDAGICPAAPANVADASVDFHRGHGSAGGAGDSALPGEGPEQRPGSALAVAAALPGGDPLAAMLAAGETPSPQMVAAAGGTVGLNVLHGAILLGLTLVGMVLVVLLSAPSMPIPRMRDGIKAPEILTDRARQILADAGYRRLVPSQPREGFGLDDQYIAWVHDVDRSSSRWDQLATARPGPIYFWYRQSPQFMISKDDIGMVTLEEPARAFRGCEPWCSIVLGRLKKFEFCRRQDLDKSVRGTMTAADFAPLFQAAELKQDNCKPVAPRKFLRCTSTSRLAWDGAYPENPDQKIHIEAAGFGGRPVYFLVRESWKDDADQRGIEADPDLPSDAIWGFRRP